MKTVLVFGTFDSLHPGHEYFLEKAASMGKRLIVIVSRDSFVFSFKQKNPRHDEVTRLELIRSHQLVSDAFLADKELGQFTVIQKVQPDIVCLGHDQAALEESLRKWLSGKNLDIKITVLKPYKRHKYSSTLLNRFKEQLHYESE